VLLEMDQGWKDWAKLNMARGCDKDGIAKILFEHGFHPFEIISEMQYLPQSPALVTAMNQFLLGLPALQATAEQQLAVYQAIDAVALPLAQKLNSNKLHLYTVENFLDKSECDELMRRIKAGCQPSSITSTDEPDKYFRTSKTCNLSVDADAFVRELDQRIAEYMGIEPQRSEGMQGQYYQVGEQFKTHTDYFEPNTPEYEKYAGARGQRTWTFMIYLNEVEEGGETLFPNAALEVQPKQGMAVVWNSLRADGAVNPDSTHWAKPIIKGEKFVITKWFRTHGSLPTPFIPFPRRKLPVFTLEGFKKTRLPAELFQRITDFYQQGKNTMQPELSDAIGTYLGSESNRHPSHMLELTDNLREQLSASIRPLLEEWVGMKLQFSAIYGIREYQRGATLKMHVDRIDSHQISAIINVAQQVDADWALHICDHKGRVHRVMMAPGDMLFYESARLQHGRPDPLQGGYFANIFAHTVPAA
jgi:prolyl 4-hydroxylase